MGVVVPSLAVVVATAVAVGLFVLWPAAVVLRRIPTRSSAFWSALTLVPAAMAVLIGIALLVPAPFGACHCVIHAPHHPHLCPAHPELAQSLVFPAVVLLVGWCAVVGSRLWRVAAEAFDAARWAKEAGGRHADVDGIDVRIVDCGAPVAVAAGAFRPEIFFDCRLWAALNDEERRVVVHHEHAHAVRLDGLTLLILRAAAALTLVPIKTRLIEAWRTSAELECDRHASKIIGDPLAVASALLSVERTCAVASTQGAAHAMLGARPGAELDRRVRALIDMGDERPPGLANDVLVVACLIGAAALVTFAWPGDGVHHAFETLIGWALG